MIPAFLAGPAIKAFFGGTWGKLIIAIMILTIGLYVRGAEKAKAQVVTLKAEKAALIQANADLEATRQRETAALQSSIQKTRERESKYASAIDEVEAQADGECVRNSPALRASVRLYRERHGYKTNTGAGAKSVSGKNARAVP